MADIDCHLVRTWPKQEPGRCPAPSVSGSCAELWDLPERWPQRNVEQAGNLAVILVRLFAEGAGSP